MDVTVYPDPNPALTAWLVGPECHRIMEERANTALLLYQAQVAKRTGRLARSARAHVEIGGVNHDRWVGELVVGDDASVDYAASHEFGRGEHAGSIHDLNAEHETIQHPAHDLNVVLAELGNF